jgi:hypothetical protein
MRSRRILLSILLFGVVAGMLAGTLGYGLYYRSDRYRRRVEAALTAFFGLPTDVEAVRPHGLRSRELSHVQMWLPERRARIFWCPRATWDASPNETGGTVLHLHDSILAIGSDAWKSDDYMRVLKASLLHNFSDLNIRQVRFHNAAITWPRREFQIRADGVDGTVTFDTSGKGEAVLTTQSLNGCRVAEPIRIHALIDPANEEDFLPEVTLEVPPLPLNAIGLKDILHSEVTQGSFSGRITLRQTPAGDTVQLAGLAQQVQLGEFTGGMMGGPVAGVVDLTIYDALIRDHELDHLRFNGEIRDLDINAILVRYGLPAIGGRINLQVHNGRLQGGKIENLQIAGHWNNGSLAELSRLLLGSAAIEGRLGIQIESIVIRDNQPVSGHVNIDAVPPPGKPGTVDRALLLSLLEKYLGFQVPGVLAHMLPDSVEFVRAEAKLLLDGNKLQILTIPRPGGGALITVRLAGQEMPLVRSIDQVFDLGPLFERARRQANEWQEHLRERSRLRPATRPAAPGSAPAPSAVNARLTRPAATARPSTTRPG